MAQHISLAVLGGSSVATPALVQALLDWDGHAHDRPEMRLLPLGRSARKLAQVRTVCEHMVREAQPGITVEASTDLRSGLWRVDFILNQMRVGGLEARAHDETFPQALGLPGEETVGPGGFANALRTIPVVNAALRIASEVAPNAKAGPSGTGPSWFLFWTRSSTTTPRTRSRARQCHVDHHQPGYGHHQDRHRIDCPGPGLVLGADHSPQAAASRRLAAGCGNGSVWWTWVDFRRAPPHRPRR